MKANHESNNGKVRAFSPSFLKNKGRLAYLPPEERSQIARKGGLARSNKKRLSCQINPIKTGKSTKCINISTCNECSLNAKCSSYRENGVCKLELNIRRNTLSQFKAFVGNNPEDLLKEMMNLYIKMEKLNKENPSFFKLTQQYYMLLKLLELKFGKGSCTNNININTSNTTIEIKQMMKELREREGGGVHF